MQIFWQGYNKSCACIIITDQRMPVTTGIEFLEAILPIYPQHDKILLTGFSDMNAVMDAINRGQV